MEPIDVLRKMIEGLPDYNQGIMADGFLELETRKGKATGYNLFNNGTIAVARTTMTAGTILDAHYHHEVEHLLVYEGALRLYLNCPSCDHLEEKDFIHLKRGDCYTIQPDIPHVVLVETHCNCIAITIPASKGFPR